MILHGIMLGGALTAAAVAAAWWWFVRCARACVAAEHTAQDLFQRGELFSALALIDSVDAQCRCSRFTSGDAPHSTPWPRPVSANC